MIKTVIFDMDGVIVDTEPVHYYAYQQHFKQLNIEISDELYASFTGFSTKNTYQRIIEIHNLDHDVQTLVQTKRNIFNEAFDTKEDLHLLEGVEDLIKELHQNGFQLIVASSASKETIERVFKRFHLHQYFSDIVSGEDFPKSKPHPAIFEHAASLSIAPKNQCIVIEDSGNGIQAAVSAGIFCIGYNSKHSKGQDLSKANLIINHFNELSAKKISNLKSAI
ncbi:HAD family hydrolase [Flavobacterium soli]|uniref:HAD family hydrolase n=1 Tax=Flavobacterium soli TaxID=344881 RepID=UPI0004091DCD|nr:HAD family hydrolase [Flavobacterium soli]